MDPVMSEYRVPWVLSLCWEGFYLKERENARTKIRKNYMMLILRPSDKSVIKAGQPGSLGTDLPRVL